jgi:hypothetical protein
MRRFRSAFGTIELTDEREKHIAAFHPDVVPHLKQIAKTLQLPHATARSRHDPEVRLFYRLISKSQKYFTVVVKFNHRKFILTAYFTKMIKHP